MQFGFYQRPVAVAFEASLSPDAGDESLSDVLDEVLRVALVRVVDDELAEQQTAAVRAVRAEHGVVDGVVGRADVTVAARLGARRSTQLARSTGDVRTAERHPHDEHVQRLTDRHATHGRV